MPRRNPEKLPSPMEWGDPEEVRRRFSGLASSVEVERRAAKFEFDSLEAAVEFFMTNTGGLVILQQMLPPDRFGDLRGDVERVMRDFIRPSGDRLLLESEYLMVVARKA